MTYSLAISPCPNDTFMFWAMLHRQIDTLGLDFDVSFKDIEQLNLSTTEGIFDITKISYARFPLISDSYQLLGSGGALGFGNGPLLIGKRKIYPDEIPHLRIAVPGLYTTANMLLSFAYPSAKDKKEYLFSDIEEVVLSNEADAGLLIHETRFTYEKKGLCKILDLGEWWEKETGLPLPLGAIAVRRNLADEVKSKINTVLSNSIRYALQYPERPMDFVLSHARAMDVDVCRRHIGLYVNDFSVDLGDPGRTAVNSLFSKSKESGLFAEITEPVFAND